MLGEGLITRWLEFRADRDGQAPALEPEIAVAPPPGYPARRPPVPPRAELDDRLAAQVLQAWLQNRHQTLFPLTVNLRNIPPDHAATLLRAMAVALTASPTAMESRLPKLDSWIDGAGGGETERRGLRDALAAPPALGPLLAEVQEAKLGPLAYAASVAALDGAEPTNALYLDYLAARLALPPEIVRSARRRHRL